MLHNTPFGVILPVLFLDFPYFGSKLCACFVLLIFEGRIVTIESRFEWWFAYSKVYFSCKSFINDFYLTSLLQ